ncbi:hypothetical protein LTS07_007508 [Exophiala sideris]|uniref:Subtilisin-like serine protease n=1 Tax=Exophiala sideris TaxID=1016849 RepID=A0ABR0J4Z4_9EURO|nr:hypothetical protein LTS07_007508 [Exophiala sideris]KAK5033686.1 hypothetical protein LTR13_006738 [Exophiala sideris]KAK5055509.1 hypothetical protein LTR69_008342 [Exophiala sideris]KAK5180109.1 hypothetical protein LTR44_007585 [Eurotiomycetes sp. CCFEE 6388]
MVLLSSANIDYHLPFIVRKSDGSIIHPRKEFDAFAQHQLDVSRLDRIAEHLWMVGRVGNVHPLHRQHVLGRQVILTEQADLHLLWIDKTIFIKPLPAWLLDEAIWKQHIRISPRLQACANGFLRTYAYLVAYECDFAIATRLNLIPEGFTWPSWLNLVQDRLLPLCLDRNPLSFAPRYTYGELRLSRINILYRLLPKLKLKHFFRGYYYGSQAYQGFLERNFAWLVAGFAYLALVLTAMQVGLATKQLENNTAFNAASYGFTIFAILVPLFAVAVVAALSLLLMIYHVRATLKHLHETTVAIKP